MGKWDHRRSRRFFRRQRSSPVPPPKFYDINAPLPEFLQDGIPLWEKKYCTLIGSVPWQKIVDSKNYMICHSNVLNWDDSAAEEAFQNAKKRYWANINSHTCDISPPDPDMYVDQIDWNPDIDPELIKEVDTEYFPVPGDEEENIVKTKRTKISVDGENPWECAGTPPCRALENKGEGCNQGDHNVNESGNVDNTENPWEHSINKRNGWSKDNTWDAVHVRSWGCNEGRDGNGHNAGWENNCMGIVSQKEDRGWGKARDSYWSPQQSNNLVDIKNSWECKSRQQNVTPVNTGWSQQNVTPVNTGWRNNCANVPGPKQWGNAAVSSNSQFRRNYGCGNSWNQSSQRREGSNRHTSGHNGSQFQSDDRQTGHYWRMEKGRKRDFGR